MKRLVLTIGVVSLAACVKPNTNTHMWTHFDAALDAHNAVLAGDLLEARQAGQWLVDHPEREMPPGSDSLVQQMKRYAARLAFANDIAEAALGTAGIAETCGDCHQAFGPGPRFAGAGVPPEALGDVGHEMRRHIWATGRLWEGLVGPSDAAWLAGARVLRDAPMLPSQLPQREGAEDTVAELERRVHEFGQLSLDATGSERSVIYSNVIATCASCHQIVRGRTSQGNQGR